MTRIWLENHPMKREALTILGRHFSPSVVNRFQFLFEAELYDAQNIRNQIRDDRMVMEVRYKEGEATEFICDIYSHMSKEEAEHKILRYVTDALKSGKIGSDWKESDIKANKDVLSGKFITPKQEDEL